jgi:hypothetical protein
MASTRATPARYKVMFQTCMELSSRVPSSGEAAPRMESPRAMFRALLSGKTGIVPDRFLT